jgi:hypothetical protein
VSARVRVWLTKKYAEIIDDVDLTAAHIGDVIEVSRRDARMLIAEGWAVTLAPLQRRRRVRVPVRDVAHDRPPRRMRRPRTKNG